MPVYSHSRIGAFEQCPRKYKFRYIEKPKIEVRRTIEQYLGDRVHKALEKCYSLAGYGRAPNMEELLALFDKLWQEEFGDDIKIVRENLTAGDYFLSGKEYLRRYHVRHYPFDQEIVIGLEKLINFSLDDDGRYRLQGFIDRLSRDAAGRLRIHDYKTSNNLPTQDDIDRDTQLALYQIAVEKMWPDNNGIELVWHYLKFDTSLISRRSPEQLENLRQEYISKIREIENATVINSFPVNESALCDWCEYFDLCPAKGGPGSTSGRQPELELLSAEELVRMVDRYVELDEKRKKIEKEQKELKGKLIGQGEIGSTRVLPGSREKGVAITLDREMKLPTRSADEARYKKISEMVTGAGLYEKYSKLDTVLLQKDMAAGRLPEDLHEALKKYQETVTREAIRIKKI